MGAWGRSGTTTVLLTIALVWAAPTGAQVLGALEPVGQTAFDHGPYSRLLQLHVTEEGLVDYDAFASSPAFAEYLQSLAEVDLEAMANNDRLALWINAYNAYTIQLILEHEERESIKNINKTLGLFSFGGAWKERLAHVGGESYTLDEIEHDIIREDFDEPRIHFAVVCAALGCPPLRREAYDGGRLDAQLHDQALRFLTLDLEKNRVDIAEEKVYLSPVFDWYREDFPEERAGLGAFLARYFEPVEVRAFLRAGDFDVEHTHYDWALNMSH